MKFALYFTIRGPLGVMEVPNKSNPVDCADLETLLRDLSGRLPHNSLLGICVVGLRVESVGTAADDAQEFDPVTKENLTGKMEPCCECGEDYPRADLVLRREIYCARCREAEKARGKP